MGEAAPGGVMVGIDIGGTFVDCVACHTDGDQVATSKTPSDPGDLVASCVRGVREVLALLGACEGEVARIAHGTTVGTNALLERAGARIGVLTTAGLEDALVIGRVRRRELYDLFLDSQTPTYLANRRRILGVRERMTGGGERLVALDEDGVRAAARRLVEGERVEAIAVSYLFSFVDPAHERRTKELLEQDHPGVAVSLSCDVDPKIREYERLCATLVDAYLKPVIARYVHDLSRALGEGGFRGRLQMMQPRGAVADYEQVVERPLTALSSGTAAGVVGATQAAGLAGFRDLISLDVGGTSADVALVRDLAPLTALERREGDVPLRIPALDVASIGAGGGSIARVDAAGALRVGPESARGRPGPACYGLGGTRPTVTDASLLLGYLGEQGLAGGSVAVSRQRAEDAVREQVARPLGSGTTEAAVGIHRIVNAAMADALRVASVRRGFDPRRFALVACGGAGPVHAGRLAADLSIPAVVVPPHPGVLSATGLLWAPMEHDSSRTVILPCEPGGRARVAEVLRALDGACAGRMREAGVPADAVGVRHFAEMRYVGQSHEVEVEIDRAAGGPPDLDALRDAFHRQHERVNGHFHPGAAVEVVTLRAVHSHRQPAPGGLRGQETGAGGGPSVRPAYFEETGWTEVPVHRREEVRPGDEVRGPAIVEQADTTTVVYPGWVGRADAHGNLILTAAGAGAG